MYILAYILLKIKGNETMLSDFIKALRHYTIEDDNVRKSLYFADVESMALLDSTNQAVVYLMKKMEGGDNSTNGGQKHFLSPSPLKQKDYNHTLVSSYSLDNEMLLGACFYLSSLLKDCYHLFHIFSAFILIT